MTVDDGNKHYNGKFIYVRIGTTSREMSFDEVKDRLQKNLVILLKHLNHLIKN